MAAEMSNEKERRKQRLEENEKTKINNLRLMRAELRCALKAIRGLDDSSDDDADNHHMGIN